MVREKFCYENIPFIPASYISSYLYSHSTIQVHTSQYVYCCMQLLVVTAYINQTCNCGPHFNSTNIIRLPLHYGPASTPKILKKVIQALVDSAINPAQVFNNLVTSPTGITITGKITLNILYCHFNCIVLALIHITDTNTRI